MVAVTYGGGEMQDVMDKAIREVVATRLMHEVGFIGSTLREHEDAILARYAEHGKPFRLSVLMAADRVTTDARYAARAQAAEFTAMLAEPV